MKVTKLDREHNPNAVAISSIWFPICDWLVWLCFSMSHKNYWPQTTIWCVFKYTIPKSGTNWIYEHMARCHVSWEIPRLGILSEDTSPHVNIVWIRGERIVFWWPNTNTNIIRVPKNDRIRIRILFGFPKLTEYEYEYYSGFQKWPNTNTNIIRLPKNDQIRIRILFGFPKMTEYEYEYYWTL